MKLTFTEAAWADYLWFQQNDKKLLKKNNALEHLLKLKYWEEEKARKAVAEVASVEAIEQEERNKKHWQSEIVNFRVLLNKRLKDSPSLKAKLPEIYTEILPDSKRSISKLFDLPETIDLPLNQVIDEDWFPN